MESKLKYVIKKCKSVFIVVLVLWVVLSIVLIAPYTVASVESKIEGNASKFDILLENGMDIGGSLSKIFKKEYIESFLKGELYLLVALFFFGIVGMIKAMPKNDYQDIEHGSSDWAKGEQYAILSKTKGIILAEKHYLPVDKRGNVNVLVVGRFWFW